MQTDSNHKFRAAAVLGVCGAVAAAAAIALAQGTKAQTTKTAQPNPQEQRLAQGATAQPETRHERRAEHRQAKREKRRAIALGMQVETQGDQLLVKSVQDNSLAAQAGIRQNDKVISVDGRTFANVRELDAYLASQNGRRVPIVVERDGQRMTLNFTAPQLPGDTAWLGVFLQEAEPNAKGVQVTQIYPTGPGARAGLRPGDTIVQIDQKQLAAPADLIALIQESEPQQQMDFTILRDNQQMKIPVTLGSRQDFRPQANGYQANYPQTYANGGQPPNGEFGNEQDEFSDVPPHAMGLEHDRMIAEQHQRIEDEIRQLREEIQKLREDLQNKNK